MGFEAEAFGGRAVVLHAVPSPHPRFDAGACFRELVADLARGRFGGWANRLERFAATYACRAAVKGGAPAGPAGDARAAAPALRHRAAAARRPRRARRSCSCRARSWSDGLGGGRVPVVVGPTAVGKTAVALALAAHWPLEMISADSRQVYRRLDIGTAKPTRKERARVPHHGLDLVDPGTRYSAGHFARDAEGWLADDPRPGPAAGRRRRHGALHPRAGRRAVSRAARSTRPGAARLDAFTARLEPLELLRWAGAARPGVSGRRAPAGRPGDRDRAAHRAGRSRSGSGRRARGARSTRGTLCSPCPGRCCISGSRGGRRRWCGAG